MDWINRALRLAGEHQELLWWSVAASLALVLVTSVVVGAVLVKLPKDYFTANRRRRMVWLKRYPALQPVIAIAKNVLGIILVVAGLLMLVLPGQGLLTLFVGLLLINFPGKYRLERWVATRPPVWKSINWFRKRAGREPLERPAA